MKYRVYKEGNYLFFEDLDNKIVYTGPDTEVKIISVDTVNENFTVNGTSPMFPNPLKFSEVYKKNLEKYSKQEWIKFYTSESNYIPTDGFTGTMDDIVDGSTYVKTENNYTDAEKTKLAGIEPFAEANNINDSDALELTDGNDTTLHFHASDRNRANHTGTQTASTISDFGTGVQNSSLSGYTLGANTPISNLDDVKGAFGKAQAQINNKQNSLGFTPEDSANKSTSTGDSGSSVKFPVWSAIVSYFSAIQIRSILGITTLSGSNTGDETTATIQSKRPLKTVNSQSLEGSGNVDLTNGFTTITKSADQDMNNTTGDDTELQFAVVAGGVYLIEFVLIMSSNNTTADSRYYFRTNSATLRGASTVTNISFALNPSTQIIQANSNYSAVVVMGTNASESLDYPETAFGAITFSSSANDTLRVGFGVNTSTVGSVTRMWKESFIRYKRIK